MQDFVRVASLGDVPDPGKKIVEVEGQIIVLIHAGGQFYGLDDVCTHDGGPLGSGSLCGFEIACPRHGAKFDVRNGKALTMPATQDTRSHQVKVVGDGVYVKLSES